YCSVLYFLTAPPTTVSSTLSLHDALPIYFWRSIRTTRNISVVDWFNVKACNFFNTSNSFRGSYVGEGRTGHNIANSIIAGNVGRSEEHTSELQSRENLVCRLLLEKKKKIT